MRKHPVMLVAMGAVTLSLAAWTISTQPAWSQQPDRPQRGPGGFGGPGGPGGPGGFDGPGGEGPGGRPRGLPPGYELGQVMPPHILRELNCSPEQARKIAALEKDVKQRLSTILTSEQKKTLASMKSMGRGRPGEDGFRGGPPGDDGRQGPPGGGRPGRGGRNDDDAPPVRPARPAERPDNSSN